MRILALFGFLPSPFNDCRSTQKWGRITFNIFLNILLIPSVCSVSFSSTSCDSKVCFIYHLSYPQIVAVYKSVSAKDMALTLQAFYYLAIQLYVVTEVYTSLYKINLLRKLYDCLDGNMEESNSFARDFRLPSMCRLSMSQFLNKIWIFQGSTQLLESFTEVPIELIRKSIGSFWYLIFRLVRLWSFQLLSSHSADTSLWAKWPKINGFAHSTLSECNPNIRIGHISPTKITFSFFVTFRTFVRIDNICAYSIMIVVSALSIYAVGLGKLFVLEMYLRGGFQLIACSKDLKNEIDSTDFIISELLFCTHFTCVPYVIGKRFKCPFFANSY